MAVFEWTEETPVTANNLNEMQELIEFATENKMRRFGKLLWQGNFSLSNPVITVPDLSDYKFIIVMLDSIPCFGTLSRGVGGIGTYDSYGISHYAYRFAVDGNRLSITPQDKGGTDGTQNVPVTKIYGAF